MPYYKKERYNSFVPNVEIDPRNTAPFSFWSIYLCNRLNTLNARMKKYRYNDIDEMFGQLTCVID